MSLLSVSGITKRFGGITANRDISFDVAAGELVGIIGPNGSGKSTLFEVISGFYHPDEGAVSLDGARLTGLSPDHVCRLGVARTFQKLRPFSGLTVVDNVMVGALTRTLNAYATTAGLLSVRCPAVIAACDASTSMPREKCSPCPNTTSARSDGSCSY